MTKGKRVKWPSSANFGIGGCASPQSRHPALENASFSRAFCCLNFGPKFRGSGREKVAAQIDEVWRDVMTQL
jgi:hypothetical protein